MNTTNTKHSGLFLFPLFVAVFLLTSVFSESVKAVPCGVTIATLTPCVCIGNTNPVHLIANPTGGSNPATYVYLWSTGASTKEIDVFPAITTTYSVTVTGGGCSATPVVQASITINAYNTPSASFTISPPPLPKKCASTEFTFIPPAVPPGEPTPVYSWTFVDQSVPPMPIAPSAQASPKRTFYKIGYGEFQVKVHLTVTRCGCQDDFEQLITVKQLPDVKLFATPANWTQCSMSSNFTLVVHPSVDDPLKNQDYKIDWESPNPLPTTGTKLFPFPVAGESNTYSGYNKWTVRYTVTSATNGCINDTVYSAFNGGNPYPALNCPGTVASTCDLPYPLDIPWNPAHMNNTPGTIYVFDYFDNDPGTVTTETRNYPLAGTGLQITYGVSSCGYTPTAPSPFAGTQNSFAIRCTVTNQCVTTGAFPPQIHDCFTGKYGNKPDPDFTIKDAAGNQITSGCTNAPITLTSTTTSLNSGGSVGDCSSAMTLNWVITPATYTIVSGLPTDPVFVVKFDPANTYTITLEASNTCPSSPASIIKSLCITDESPVALFDINVNPANPNSCSEVTLETVNSSSAADPCGLVHYTWSTTYNGGTCSGSPGTPVYVTGNSTSFEPVIKLVDPGTYILKLVVNNSCGSAEYTKTIVVKGPPKVTISTSSTPAAPPYCAGNTYTFNMNVESCFGTLIPGSENWYLDPPSPVPPYGIPPVTGLSFTPLLSAGPHTIIAEVENECGIGSKTINITLSVSPTMTLSIAPATSISVCSQDNICLIYPGLFVSSTATTFKWTSALITGSISGFTNNSGTAGTCITDILTNSLLTTGIVRYTITPATLGCDGPPVVLDVFVKPKPSLTVTNPAGPPFVESICNGDNTFIKLSTDIPSTISWVAPALTNVNPVSAGGGASPVTVTNTLTLANASNPGSAVYTFTVMSAGGCPGPGATVTENVNTIPVLTTLPLNKTICSTDYTGISLTPVTNNYSWTATLLSGSVTGFSGNSGTFINQQLTNVSSTTAGVVRYVITPQALPCSGSSYNFDVTVNPRPVPTITPCNATVFFGDVITYHTETGKSNYSWVVNGGSITGGGGTADDFVTVKWTSGTTGSVCVNYQLVTGSLGCAALAPVCCNVVVNPCPLTQTVTLQSAVNGSLQNYFCEGDPGIDVCVGNSEPGIYYEIIYSGTGTSVRNYTGGIGGGPFCFAPPLNITGTYYVQATNIASGCVVVFSPPFSILKVTPPGIPAVTPTGPECENPDGTPPGVVLGLSGWQTGIDYEWRLGLGPWTLSGGPPILTTALSPGQYFARAVDPITGCISNAANSVWVMPKPIKYALFPFGVLCGCRDITLTNSQAGFKYKLINQSTGVTTLWISTGGSHVFQNICDTGTYVIEAQDTITPPFCTQQMDWSLTLIENPHSYSLLPSGPNCQGVELKLANSDPGVVYELRYMVTGDAVKYMHSLLGGELNFGILGSSYSEGTYKIFAKQGTSVNTDSCVTEMFGQIDLCRNPTPKIISPSGATCSLTTSTITLFNPDPTVTYHLIKDGNTGSPLISLTVGTPTLVFNSVNCVPPLPVFPAGTYTIRAVHTCPSISCELEFGIVNIEPGPSVDAGIPDPLTECAGAATVIPLLGTAADYDPLSVTWKVLIGPGTVSPTNTLGTQYTPGSAPGTRILRLEVSGVNSCVGIKQHDDRTIIINTLGQVNDPTDQVVCNGASTAPVSFTTINTGGTNIYTWTNSTTNIGLAATGTGNIPSFQAINTGSAPVTATIIVTPHFTTGGVTCDGPPETFTITVNPSAEVDQPVSQVVCQGTAVAATNFTTTTTGGTATYTWTNSTTSIGLAPSGTGDIAAFTAINAGTSPVTATIVVTPHFENGTVTCDGPSKSFTVTVNPAAAVDQPASQVICNGSTTAAVSFTTTNTGGTVTYSWTNSTTTIGLAASGTGNIGTFTAINTGTSPVTATIIVTPHFENGSVTCDGSSKSFTVTVNPTGEVDQPQSQVLCNGSTTTPVNFTTTTTGGTATYTWTNSNTSIGLAANGTGNIAAFTALNTGTVPVTATITVTPHFENGLVVCDGPAKIFTVTVNPAAEAGQPVSQVVCHGGTTSAVTFTTTNTGGTVTFTWTNSNTNIGLASSGTGNIASFTADNTGTSPVTATITVTPHFANGAVSCDGPVKTFTITVNPTAQVNQPGSQVICNGSATAAVNFTSATSGGTSTYTWSNSTPAIGLPASGTGDIAAFTALNAGSAPVTATIIVTPHFEHGSVMCDGPAKTFTVTVNPTGEVDQPVSQVVCQGTAVAATNFTTTTTGGTATYTWTNSTTSIGLAPSGTGDIAAFTAINAGTSPVTATIVVTPHFENGTVTCDGPSKSFTVTVNPAAAVDQPASQVICNGSTTAAVSFTTTNTGGTVTYSWTNSTTTIGLAASGTGNIGTFTAINTGTSPVTATIIVTPHFENGSVTCDGSSKSFTVTVNPTGEVDQPQSQVLCNGSTTTPVNFTTTTTGGTATYTWTNSNTSIGLAANGTGNIAAFTALNTGTVPVTATITVTPHFENGLVVCDGPAKIFTVTVNPAAEVDQPVSQVLCNGDMTTVINFTTPNTGGTITFTWTNDTPGIGLAASGVGNIVPFAVVNTGTSPVTATITVTPHFESGLVICDGQPKSFTFTVNPTAQVDQPASQVVCNAGITSSIFFTTINTGGTVTYSWTNSVTTIGLAANGTGDIASFTAVNSGTIPVAATIVVTPHFESGSVVCDGPSKSFTITVNPTAEVDQPFSQVICNGSITAATIFTTANAGGTTTYTWTNDTPGIGLVSSGSGDIQAFTAINTGSVPVTATIIVTPHFENALLTCDGQPKSFTITVNPTAEVDQPSSQIVCQGAPTSLVVFTTLTTGGTTTYTWVNDTPGIGFPATGMGDIAPFFANNAGSGPVVATITVTPHFQHGPIICDGPAKSFTITVNPSAAVIQPVNQSVCSGSLTSAVNFTSSNTGGITTYTWTNSTTGIGLAGNGVGNIAAFIVVNTGILPVTATIVVTPHFENGSVICDGPSKSFTITANPTPLVPDQVSTICSGSQFLISPVNDPPLTVLPAGTTYSWSAPAVSSPLLIGGAAGTGMSGINGTLTNYSTSTQTAIYTVTPTSGTSGNCVGNSFTVTVEVVVAPTPTITSSAQAVTPCVNSSGNIYTTQPGMTNYLWSGIFPPNTYVTGPDPNSITVTWITPGIKSLTVSYSSPLCSQVMPPVPYQVFVEPQPVPSISTVPQGINECCIGDPAITFVTEDDMDTYVWTVNGGTKVAENGHTLSVVWNTVTSPSNITNVTVSYMNQFGCTAAAPTVYPFTVHALPPTPTINGDTAVCAGDVRTYSTEVGMADYQWSVFPVNNVTGLGTPVITVTWTEVGANLVTVYYKNSNGCYPASPRDTIINVYPLPVPEVEFGEQLVCDSTIYSYSTTPGKLFYEWSFDPGDASHIESGATTSSPTVHWIRGGVAVHHLFVNYSDAHGCRGIEPTPAYEVTVKELPVPSITSTFSDVCQYSDNNVYTTESGPLLGNYQWSVLPDGSITSGAGTPEITVTWNSTGAKTVSVTYTQDNCPATLLGLFSVAVNPLPNPSISGPDSVCQDKTETYVTQNNMSEYHWEVLGGTLQSADGLSFINVKWTDPGPRTISVNYKDAHGCKALFPTDSTVHVIGKPTLAISGPQNNICVGETGVYSTLPGQASYFWTIPSGSGTILSNGNYTVTVTWTTPGSQYLILKVTNDFGCDSVSNQYPVTVNPRPAISVNLGAPLTSCSDSLNNVYSTATGMSEYRWRISGGTFTSPPAITSNQVTVNWGATGPYWISVNYVNQYGCWAIADTLFEVSVSPRPKASFDYSIFSACDSSIILTNNSTPLNGSNTYMWNYGDGPAVMNQLPTFTHDYRSTNLHQPSYLVSLKVLNTNGCPDTASRMVRMQPCIQAGYMYNALLACSRYKVVFTDTSATPAQMVMHWKWEWDDGTPDTEYNNFKPAVTHIFQVAGTYHVRLTVGPVVPGIPASTVEQVIVISPTPLPSFTSTSVCKDQAAYFTDKTNYFGLDTTSVRIWYFNGNSVAPGDTSQVHNPSHIYTKIQYDSVKLFVSNAFGCMDSITRKIKVHGLPVASFTNAAACSGNTTLFTDKSVFAEAVLSAWRWGFDDPASSSDSAFVNNPGHRFDAAGDYQVWMRVTDLLGCYSTKDSTIHVNETPVSSFTITDNFNGTKGQVQMNNTTIGSNVSYAWSFENGLPTTSYEADPVTLFKDDGKHTIRLISTNTFDCADTTYYDYEFFFAGLYVPNAFSPTNTSASYAGIRYFLPVGMNLDEYQVQVFDSWGHLLWESTRLKNENGILGMPAEGWDGTYEGQLMPQGNYIWKISAKFLDGSQWEGSDIGVGKSRGTWGTVVLIR